MPQSMKAEFTTAFATAAGSTARETYVERMADIMALRRDTPEVTKMNAAVAPLLNHADTRRILYKLWWAYYENSVYKSIHEGGYRALINERLGDAKVGGLAGLYNPVERAADAYQFVFDGVFGDEIKIDKKQPDGKTPVNDKIIEHIEQVWKWSNMTDEAELLCRYTPVLGSCGIRIAVKNSPNVDNRRIFMTIEHPNLIRDVDVDERGNIRQIILEYDKLEGELAEEGGDIQEWHSYVEYMSDKEFWMQRDGDWWNMVTQQAVDTKEAATVTNIAGFVPYVIVRHRNVGGTFGVPCFFGQEEKIDHVNALATHIAHQVHKHVTATWLLEAGGPEPDFIQLGDMNVIYVQRELGQTSAAKMEALVADLSLTEAAAYVSQLQTELMNSMPELKATDGQFLSHQSGGTVAQLRTPAEQRIKKGRWAIETGLVKAQKIALSLGIVYNMWDIGTGMGRTAADKAYHDGELDHRFAKRSALPLSVDDQLTVAKTEQAEAAASGANTPGVQGGNNKVIPSPTSGKQPGTSSTTSN